MATDIIRGHCEIVHIFEVLSTSSARFIGSVAFCGARAFRLHRNHTKRAYDYDSKFSGCNLNKISKVTYGTNQVEIRRYLYSTLCVGVPPWPTTTKLIALLVRNIHHLKGGIRRTLHGITQTWSNVQGMESTIFKSTTSDRRCHLPGNAGCGRVN